MMFSTFRQGRPRQLLSPVDEAGEDMMVIVRTPGELEELNNSSVIPVASSKICNDREPEGQQEVTMTSYHHGNNVELYGQRTSDTSVNKTYIESCSGRKHEDTEVLKQKYLNSEIRDLPGKVKNTFHHKRLLKTRSTHSNTGSPDLKTHLHKMHLKSTLKCGASCENLTPKQRYRCRKLSDFRIPTHILKRSMAEILYGDNDPDDTDPEIAALFENYVEECEHLAKHKPEPGGSQGKEGYDRDSKDTLTLRKLVNSGCPEETEAQHPTSPVSAGDQPDFLDSILNGSNEAVDENDQVKRLVERKIFSPNMREKSLNVHKYKAANLSNLCDDDMNIVRLAKLKLEQRLMAKFAMDEAYLNKLKHRTITNDIKPGIRQKGDNKNKTKTDGANRNKLFKDKLEDFEGWETFKQCFDEHDHIESAESLHRVESMETLYDYETPMWTPSRSTPIDGMTKVKSSRDATPDVTLESVIGSRKQTPYDRQRENHGDTSACDSPSITTSEKHDIGLTSDYKHAARLIKLRLTKSIDLAGTDTPLLDKSFVNVPLSQCVNYNIENRIRSGVQVTTSINLSEKLAQQLKEMSQKDDKLRVKVKERSVHYPKKLVKPSNSVAETPELPSVNGDSVKPKPTENASTSESMSFPDINAHSPNTMETINKARRNIPRTQGNTNDVGERKISEGTDLPSISVKALASNNPKEHEVEVHKHDNEEQRSMYGGVAVRAGVCTSPYKFDKQDPNMLQLKARQLPGLHSVCTSCGCISEKPESPRSSSRNTSTIWRRKSDCKLKDAHKQCCAACVDDKYKLDQGCTDLEGLPKVAVEKMPHTPTIRTPRSPTKPLTSVTSKTPMSSQTPVIPLTPVTSKTKLKSMTPNMLLAPTSQKQKCEEMSINFMDRNIKFRFQTEDPSDSSGKTGSDWLKNISAPTCRDRFECPVTSETRIYKDEIKRFSRIDSRSNLSTPVSSPYLDYCKHRAQLRAVRQDRIGRKFTGDFSDTSSSVIKQDKKVQKPKAFPVLPIKKNKDNRPRRKTASEDCNMYIIGKTGKDERSDLYVKPTKPACLPEIKSETFALSRENINNNVVAGTVRED